DTRAREYRVIVSGDRLSSGKKVGQLPPLADSESRLEHAHPVVEGGLVNSAECLVGGHAPLPHCRVVVAIRASFLESRFLSRYQESALGGGKKLRPVRGADTDVAQKTRRCPLDVSSERLGEILDDRNAQFSQLGEPHRAEHLREKDRRGLRVAALLNRGEI